MEKNLPDNLYLTLDKLRGVVSFNAIKYFKVYGLFHGVKRIEEMVRKPEMVKLISDSYSLTLPVNVYKFIFRLANFFAPQKIIDPWFTISSPALILSLENVTGVSRFQNESERIESLFPNYTGRISIGDIVNQTYERQEKYDLILCFPPFGMKEPRLDKTKPTYDYSTNLILKCSELLMDKGRMIFILSTSFFNDDKTKDLLVNSGLFVDAIFSIPTGAFLPQTNISSNLVILSKNDSGKSFVAEISSSEDTNNLVFENYKNRKEGKLIQLGGFVDVRSFKSLRSLVFHQELNELVIRLGYPPVKLTDIALNIAALKDDNPDDVEHIPNSIYLPKIGNSPVVFSPSNMKIKPKNYYQIQLNEQKASANYVANYFNTEIGKKLRLSLEVGSVIMQIPKTQLLKCVLHLPDISIQSELTSLNSKIEQLQLSLNELKIRLWKHPKSHNSVLKELKSINQEDKIERWIDILPFPISSILWRYYTTKETDKKIEHMFHFFEAFSEFLSMIILSAFVQDAEFYRNECHRWIETDMKFKDWYKKATFGSWNILSARLSKTVRECLSDKDKMDVCLRIFGNPSDSFINIITNKGIIRILNEVAELRNKWKGHGGISSAEENTKRVIVLEQQLNELRKYISDGFEESRIFAPTTSSFEDGIFTYYAKELLGARTPFNEVTVSSLIPLDRKKLYLAHNQQTRPIELLPFIKYFESTEAVYFFMSVESKDIRWVSYHYDKEPEILQPADNEIFKALDFLKEQDN